MFNTAVKLVNKISLREKHKLFLRTVLSGHSLATSVMYRFTQWSIAVFLSGATRDLSHARKFRISEKRDRLA
jgi:hypothetical protein